MKTIVTSFLILSLLTSCKNNKASEKNNSISECIKYNNAAMKILQAEYYMNNNVKILDSVELLLMKSINCDTNYFMANYNLFMLYNINNNNSGQLSIIDKLYRLSNHNPDFIMKKGIVYEKIGDINNAKKYYSLAEDDYNANFNKTKDFNFVYRKALLYILLYDKQKAVDLINKDVTDIKKQEGYKKMLENFSRDRLINPDKFNEEELPK